MTRARALAAMWAGAALCVVWAVRTAWAHLRRWWREEPCVHEWAASTHLGAGSGSRCRRCGVFVALATVPDDVQPPDPRTMSLAGTGDTHSPRWEQ